MIVVPTLECGGLERNVANLCNHINTEKFDVTLVVINNAHPFYNITNNGVQVINLGIVHVRKSVFSLLRLAKKTKPDVLLSTANHLNLLLAITKWMFPRKMKILARESSIVSLNTASSWNPRLFHWLLKSFYYKLDMLICQSEYMQLDLITHYNIKKSQTRIIHNAVIPPEILPEIKAGKAVAELITVARLSKEKGLARLIKSVSQLKCAYRYTIIGDGPLRNSLQQLINSLSLQHKIFLAGNHALPFSQIPAPDLFLMGSYYEGFPNAMLEALSAGIPAVAFNAPGGISEIIEDYRNGILVNDDDEKVFADAIQKALELSFDKNSIRRNILAKHNIDTVIRQWEQLFNSLIGD